MATRRAGQPPREAAKEAALRAPFLMKTYDLVNDPETDKTISWGPDGNSFIVWRNAEFARDLLPLHFKHSNFASFVRQLNTYGFRKVDPDRWEFANPLFVRGHPELLGDIHRRKPAAPEARGRGGAGPDGAGLTAVELGVYGGLAADVETLQRDKRLLMAEVVRLRQAQTASEAALAGLQARVEAGEARQQQLLAFFSSAMQHPALLQHLTGAPTQVMPRIDDGRRRKKRRGGGVHARGGGESDSEGSGDETSTDKSAFVTAPDHRLIVHNPAAAAGSVAGGAAPGSLAELAQAFMRLLQTQSQPLDPAAQTVAAGRLGVVPGSAAQHHHPGAPMAGVMPAGHSAGTAFAFPGASVDTLGAAARVPSATMPVFHDLPISGNPGSPNAMGGLFDDELLHPLDLGNFDLSTLSGGGAGGRGGKAGGTGAACTPDPRGMSGFVPVPDGSDRTNNGSDDGGQAAAPSPPPGSGPLITEIKPDALGELPTLDNFSLSDLDTLQAHDHYWPAVGSHSGVGHPDVSSPSFSMVDLPDTMPIITEPSDS